jgi:NitT/TauT family transport system permease protein
MSIAEDRPVALRRTARRCRGGPPRPQPADRDHREMGPARRDHDPDDLSLGLGRARQRDPHFILPGPDRVWDSLVNDWGILIDAAYLTGWITFLALILAVVGGAGLAILFNQSKMLELSFYPYAVILQVTPIVSIAPLIFIYVDSKIAGMLLCAWLVAFFPVLSSTTLGLNSVDHNLRDLFRIYGATRGSGCASCNCPRRCPISSAG